ncbi:methionine ABC transporter ATP-binding protein [Pseudomonas chlororaphis]|uniref:methionine ABC transporter ATP-binding protein n=1 Tax=Pseudomonas chlororaphis TaxID=587753 RepID=UPI00209B10DF|nr:methionine ABC transporter ATP-binding protein [Pseudomonas chlororaphis]MCO7573579.1 methionine ABC transporter ATP-binding protein [Pseudomonas chlororaphis]MCO7591917.1 methionine ABC transporter ATP-binding protein [Pseudomonas chlororaphis]
MIQVQQVSKVYGEGQPPALDRVSLTVPDGAVYGILGRSGAGKSTLLRCLNLLERPSSGRILIDGQDLGALSASELRRQRQGIGMIFQGFNLLHSRTVEDNVAVPLEIAGLDKKQRRARVLELLDLVGLSDKAQAFPSQLSGGQKQRVGIARALAVSPRYLLSDEATSALDPETTASILQLLTHINRELGLTIVLITHELAVVKAICSHAASLAQGRLLESGPVGQLLADPQSALGRALLPDYNLPFNGSQPEAELTFFDNQRAAPLLQQLSQQQGLPLKVLAAGVETVGGQRVGRLRIAAAGADAGKFQQLLSALTRRGIRSERL